MLRGPAYVTLVEGQVWLETDVERFQQAQDKKFGSPAETAKETKSLLAKDAIDDDDAADDEPVFKADEPISSERIKALLDRQVALTSEIDNEFDDSDEDDDDDAPVHVKPKAGQK
eukprot:CAMPEP_0185211170 /NCGR_PEP_ID=MMETSP1140-20130426/66890_1 /TAXON_ID=298111 /ORGANISM="Pavlova sp., Strain CCMP459" /LENGTH=114 /DNA_ID=CAMNT_0027779009 /DNA_START=365 /DNA_END=710 /DNA_ORIENTATION=+